MSFRIKGLAVIHLVKWMERRFLMHVVSLSNYKSIPALCKRDPELQLMQRDDVSHETVDSSLSS